MSSTRPTSDLAETIARVMALSLSSPSNPHRDLEAAAAVTVESVAAQLGAAGVEPEPPRQLRAGPASARALARERARALEAAGEATTPPDVPRVKPRRMYTPSKPWASQRSRARFVAAVARTNNPRFAPKDWCDRTWAGVRAAFYDTGGARACAIVGELPRALAMAARVAIVREQQARGDLADGIDWTHITARGIACCAVVLYRESQATTRRGWARVLVGVSQNMFASLFRNPHGGRDRGTGPRYHRNTLFATELHGDKARGGWVRALERAGFVYIEQPPAEVVPDALRGPSGFALAQYWLTERVCCAEPRAVDVRELHAARALADDYTASSSPARAPPD